MRRIPQAPGFECAEDVFIKVEGGDDNDGWGRIELLDESGCFESIAVGHTDIHANDVGVESLCFGDGLLSCAGFATTVMCPDAWRMVDRPARMRGSSSARSTRIMSM